MLADLHVALFVGRFGLLDFCGEVLNAGVEACYLVLQVLYSLWQFATDNLDFVYLAVHALQGVEGYKPFLDGHVDVGAQDGGGFYGFYRFFSADFLGHNIFIYLFYNQMY